MVLGQIQANIFILRADPHPHDQINHLEQNERNDEGVTAAHQNADGLRAELAGLALGRTPSSLPDWSGLLVGSLFRGTAVSLR